MNLHDGIADFLSGQRTACLPARQRLADANFSCFEELQQRTVSRKRVRGSRV